MTALTYWLAREAEADTAPPAARACTWCDGGDAEPADPAAELCRPHLAEYEGLSLDGLDRMEAEEAADLL